jgi:hypothetical protein
MELETPVRIVRKLPGIHICMRLWPVEVAIITQVVRAAPARRPGSGTAIGQALSLRASVVCKLPLRYDGSRRSLRGTLVRSTS